MRALLALALIGCDPPAPPLLAPASGSAPDASALVGGARDAAFDLALDFAARDSFADGGAIAWTVERSGALDDNLLAVWGSGPADVWVATFATVTVGARALNAVTGSATDDVWIAGDDGALHSLDGATSFVHVATPAPGPLNGAWSFGPRDDYLVGAQGTILRGR